MSKNQWWVVDWMDNLMYDGKRFDSFEEARDYIQQQANENQEQLAKELSTPGYPVTEEEANDAYCEDMYAQLIGSNE